MAHASGCRNFIIVLVVLAVVGAWWWFAAPPEGGFLHFVANMVGATSSLILVVTFYAIVVNFGRIIDWCVIRVPPTFHDAVLGDLRYDDGRWSTRLGAMNFWLEGRRRGPDDELVRAGAQAVSNLDDYDRRARAYALARLSSVDSIQALTALSAAPWGREKVPSVVLWFALSDDEEDYLRVTFLAGEPVDAEASNRYLDPPA